MLEKALEFLRENRLAELLTLINEFPDLVFEFDQSGWTLLMEAIKENNEKAIEILLNHNADIHAVESEHQVTPLLLATRHGNIQVCRKLIEAGADPEVKDLQGQTCLIVAVKNKHKDIVALLLEYGVLTDRFDQKGNNALIYAIEMNQAEIVKSLVFSGASTEIRNSAGMNIKQIAEKSENPEIVLAIKKFRDD
jgi:ankyrin repeat protein